jgi:hypothetical protein
MKNSLDFAPNYKRLAVLIAAAMGSFMFSLVNPAFGFPLVLAFIIAPIMSYCFIKFAASRMRIEISLSKSYIHKGESFKVNITIHNDSFFQIPALKIPMKIGEGLKNVRENYQTENVTGKITLVSEYTAVMWGKQEITADDCIVNDLLGLFSVTVEFTKFNDEVKVYPELFTPETNELAVSLQSNVNEKEEESMEGIRSEPGYEHRAYEPGDPIKRINWKYSAKKDTLLVRTLESSGFEEFIFLLHPAKNTDLKNAIYEARLVEGFLAMLISMRKLLFKCKAHCYLNNAWYCFAINTMDDIFLLQEALCHFSFVKNIPALPISDNETSVTVFTCQPETVTVKAEIVCAYPYVNTWLISEKYDIYRGF